MENRKLILITTTLAILGVMASGLGCSKARYSYNLGDAGLAALNSGAGGGAGQKTCANTTPTVMTAPLSFPTPSTGCAWNADGNLGFRDLHFQARREQVAIVTIPANAIVCDMEFDFPAQPIYYDDEFVFTFDNKVLASSYNLEPLLTKTGNLLSYEWTKMVGLPWSAATPTPYCVGEDQSKATCSFPATSMNGTIALDYDPSIVQEAFAQSPTTGTHEFRWITTGDNDNAIDCLHTAINATVRLSYVQ